MAAPADATRIAYRAVDLPDVGPLDLWRYEYFVSERDFASGEGFSIRFPVGTARDLVPVSGPADLDWDVLALQPEPLLASDGRYDAQARIAAATLLSGFTLDFHWLSDGTPGAQFFEIYDPGFEVLETGQTMLVPEPGTALLLAAGLVALARRRDRMTADSRERL
jgi:hypothetical protein